MRAANGMGTVFKLSGNRRKPWALLGPKYYSTEEKHLKSYIGYGLSLKKMLNQEQNLTMKLILKEVKNCMD